MTIDEYKARIDGLLTNPDTALAEVAGVYEELETDLTTLESVTAEVEELRERVKNLQETNVKLYLSQGEPEEDPEDDPEDERDEDEKAVDDFFDDVLS